MFRSSAGGVLDCAKAWAPGIHPGGPLTPGAVDIESGVELGKESFPILRHFT